MLSRYHNLPDHFDNLKTTLQAKFNLLKQATLKNIQNIHEAVQSQQAYMVVLLGHISTLPSWHISMSKYRYTAYTHIHNWYDPDIDRDLDPTTGIQPLNIQPPNAQSNKEDTPTDTPKPDDHTTIPSIMNRPEHQPSEVLPDIDCMEYDNIEQP